MTSSLPSIEPLPHSHLLCTSESSSKQKERRRKRERWKERSYHDFEAGIDEFEIEELPEGGRGVPSMEGHSPCRGGELSEGKGNDVGVVRCWNICHLHNRN